MNTYQQIREQLINLSVDLEDKSKVCKILEQKVRGERDQLGLIESRYEEKYQLIIKVIRNYSIKSCPDVT